MNRSNLLGSTRESVPSGIDWDSLVSYMEEWTWLEVPDARW